MRTCAHTHIWTANTWEIDKGDYKKICCQIILIPCAYDFLKFSASLSLGISFVLSLCLFLFDTAF